MNKNKSIIDTYNTMFDVDLVVCNEYTTIEDIKKLYMFYDNIEITKEEVGENVGCVMKCIRKSDNSYCSVMWFRRTVGNTAKEREAYKTNIIAHESTHVALDIYEKIGATVDVYNQEPFAYIVGYISECIYKTLSK